MYLDEITGLIDSAEFIASPNCDDREDHSTPSAIIIHCISLPPGEYGGDSVVDFFTNHLDENSHAYFQEIKHLNVSSHFFIRRVGTLIQFVPTHLRAWHAGESFCLDKPKVNDFSIGIELEGLDTDPNGFSDSQYSCLKKLCDCLQSQYLSIEEKNIFAHSDIAPGRKPDPGPYFDWKQLF